MIPDLVQWDVVRVRIRPGDKDLHPAVIISRADVCADERKQTINVIYGSTRRPASHATTTDVILNGADGLDRPTVFNCDHLSPCAKTAWTRVMVASPMNAVVPSAAPCTAPSLSCPDAPSIISQWRELCRGEGRRTQTPCAQQGATG